MPLLEATLCLAIPRGNNHGWDRSKAGCDRPATRDLLRRESGLTTAPGAMMSFAPGCVVFLTASDGEHRDPIPE